MKKYGKSHTGLTEVNDYLTNNTAGFLDELQLVLDKYELSSEVHMVIKINHD